MNKFSEWIQENDKKQYRVAERLGIGASSLHDILKRGQLPSLKVAYAIEVYTNGDVTMYDWVDQSSKKSTIIEPSKKMKAKLAMK